jgi:hypothetical protein
MSVGNEMLVGKACALVSDNWSANKYWSGKTFADWTYSDRQGWSAKHIPNQHSVGASGFPDQFVCWEYCAVVY